MPSSKKYVDADQIEEDREVLVALKQLANYSPASGMPTVSELIDLDNEVRTDQEGLSTSEQTVVVSRSKLNGSSSRFHEEIMRSKAQVIAQYGRDSDEVRSLGLKRLSDRKRPVRSKTSKP